MVDQSEKKRLLIKTKIFCASILTKVREMPKTKVKNPGKMCQLIFLEIFPQ